MFSVFNQRLLKILSTVFLYAAVIEKRQNSTPAPRIQLYESRILAISLEEMGIVKRVSKK